MEKSGLQDIIMEEKSPNTTDLKINDFFDQIKKNKFNELYEDAKQRFERQDKIYSACVDKECTFKPKLVTEDSKLS